MIRYMLEIIIGYLLGIKDGFNSFADYLFMAIGILLLPAVLVMLFGIIFISTVMILGYFILLALISPKTAEEIIREIIKSHGDR